MLPNCFLGEVQLLSSKGFMSQLYLCFLLFVWFLLPESRIFSYCDHCLFMMERKNVVNICFCVLLCDEMLFCVFRVLIYSLLVNKMKTHLKDMFFLFPGTLTTPCSQFSLSSSGCRFAGKICRTNGFEN